MHNKTVILRISTIIFFGIAMFCGVADAQKKGSKRPAPKPTPGAFTQTLEVRLAKEKVSNQVFNLTQFTSKLGPIAASLESDSKATNSKLVKQYETNKAKLVETIRGVRAGLVSLETDFRSKPSLRRFLPQIGGITQLGAESEDLAYAGKFTESRRPLLNALQKLSDTLAVMP